MSNSTSDFRNAFLKTIRQIIRESVRNMSIPPTAANPCESVEPAVVSPPRPNENDPEVIAAAAPNHVSSQSAAPPPHRSGMGPASRRRRQAGASSAGQRRQRSVHYAPTHGGGGGANGGADSDLGTNFRHLSLDDRDCEPDCQSETDSTRDGEYSSGIKSDGEDDVVAFPLTSSSQVHNYASPCPNN